MSVSENISFWKKKSEIDYIPLFVFLWFALNVWMRDHFFKETNDRQRLNMLKRSGGSLLGAFNRLILAQNANGERFRSEFGELHDALVSARIPYDENRWPNKTINFDCCIIDWNNGQPDFESILVFSEEIGDDSGADSNPGSDEKNKIELNDDLWVENDPERLFAAYMEIVYQIRNSLFHGDLATNTEDIANKRVVRQLYLTLSMVMEDI